MDTRLEKLLNENFEEFLNETSREKLLSCEEELAFITAAQEKGLECEEADRLEKANLRFAILPCCLLTLRSSSFKITQTCILSSIALIVCILIQLVFISFFIIKDTGMICSS